MFHWYGGGAVCGWRAGRRPGNHGPDVGGLRFIATGFTKAEITERYARMETRELAPGTRKSAGRTPTYGTHHHSFRKGFCKSRTDWVLPSPVTADVVAAGLSRSRCGVLLSDVGLEDFA
jgi:hypothetical protein